MSELLRRAGFTVHHIFEVYPNRANEKVADPEWIQLCGEKGWIVITGDKRIETVPVNRQAVIEARVKVFLLSDSNSRPEIWGAAVIVGQYRMAEFVDRSSGPFFVSVQKRSDAHVSRFRRPFGFSLPDPSGS